jgi:hypothetical protein
VELQASHPLSLCIRHLGAGCLQLSPVKSWTAHTVLTSVYLIIGRATNLRHPICLDTADRFSMHHVLKAMNSYAGFWCLKSMMDPITCDLVGYSRSCRIFYVSSSNSMAGASLDTSQYSTNYMRICSEMVPDMQWKGVRQVTRAIMDPRPTWATSENMRNRKSRDNRRSLGLSHD